MVLSAAPSGPDLGSRAVALHRECRETTSATTCAEADLAYRQFLNRSPDDPRTNAVRFFWAELLFGHRENFEEAARQYALVLTAEPAGKFAVNAAYGLVLATEAVVKAAEATGRILAPTVTDWRTTVPIPAEKLALLEACDRYLARVPDGEHQVEVEYKAAKVLYDYNHAEAAVARLSAIALDHPEYKFENGDGAAEVAANLILDTYNFAQDWVPLNAWARRFYAVENLGSPAFRDDVRNLIATSEIRMFKLEGRAAAAVWRRAEP